MHCSYPNAIALLIIDPPLIPDVRGDFFSGRIFVPTFSDSKECEMTTEENKHMAICTLEPFNSRNMADLDRLVDEIYASDYILHDPGLPDFGTGPDPVKKFSHALIENTPDIHLEVKDVFGEGDKVATRFTVVATNPLTKKPEVTEVMVISRFSGNKIVEEWQLGVQIEVPVKA
jgi:predicted SnoaL-like aldol condensation-catalyzing enzyme